MDQIVSWVATAATVTAATMTASNLGSRITGYGFAVFTVGSISWLALGLITDQAALVWTNSVLTLLNLFGVWRWLGRQSKIETGAEAAAEASQHTPGEAMFALSLLTRAPVTCADGTQAGSCVDAMAGCRSGRIAYLVVSEGGVAGVGETLRRVPWSDVTVDGDSVGTRLDPHRFAALEAVPRDAWPAR
ncbi:MAG: PRC-barrel domain-containing protein [Pseudomonadota bacterium]|nr:PRC-barrel domain-containing protein [Pseudomonadota bacterium]